MNSVSKTKPSIGGKLTCLLHVAVLLSYCDSFKADDMKQELHRFDISTEEIFTKEYDFVIVGGGSAGDYFLKSHYYNKYYYVV